MSEATEIRKPLLAKWQIRFGVLLFVSILMFPPTTRLVGKSDRDGGWSEISTEREWFLWDNQFVFDFWHSYKFYERDTNIDWGWIAFCMVWYLIVSTLITSFIRCVIKLNKDDMEYQQRKNIGEKAGAE